MKFENKDPTADDLRLHGPTVDATPVIHLSAEDVKYDDLLDGDSLPPEMVAFIRALREAANEQ